MRKAKPIFKSRSLSNEDALIESFRKDIEIAREQVKKGKVYSQEEIFKEFGL